jgi:hypothetical protein
MSLVFLKNTTQSKPLNVITDNGQVRLGEVRLGGYVITSTKSN